MQGPAMPLSSAAVNIQPRCNDMLLPPITLSQHTNSPSVSASTCRGCATYGLPVDGEIAEGSPQASVGGG